MFFEDIVYTTQTCVFLKINNVGVFIKERKLRTTTFSFLAIFFLSMKDLIPFGFYFSNKTQMDMFISKLFMK